MMLFLVILMVLSTINEDFKTYRPDGPSLSNNAVSNTIILHLRDEEFRTRSYVFSFNDQFFSQVRFLTNLIVAGITELFVTRLFGKRLYGEDSDPSMEKGSDSERVDLDGIGIFGLLTLLLLMNVLILAMIRTKMLGLYLLFQSVLWLVEQFNGPMVP